MKVEAQLVPLFATNMERLFSPMLRSISTSEHIREDEIFDGIAYLHEWGLQGMRYAGIGVIGCVADGSDRFNGLISTAMISVQIWTPGNESDFYEWDHTILQEPVPGADPQSIESCWRVAVDSTKHTGLTIAHFAVREMIELAVSW